MNRLLFLLGVTSLLTGGTLTEAILDGDVEQFRSLVKKGELLGCEEPCPLHSVAKLGAKAHANGIDMAYAVLAARAHLNWECQTESHSWVLFDEVRARVEKRLLDGGSKQEIVPDLMDTLDQYQTLVLLLENE